MIVTTVVALGVGAFLPLRWGVWGFAGAALMLFLAQAGAFVLRGFNGTSLEESLLLFGGSYVGYLGWNLQLALRGFALPVLALAISFIFRLTRR